MQLMVVLVRSSGICMDPAAAKAASSISTIWSLSAEVRMPATHSPVRGSTTLPQALTETTAPTLTGPSATAAVPRPAFMQVAGPMSLPTVAPVPAPTLPCSSVVGVLSSASRTAAMPASMSGRTVGSPKARSKIQLEHTMGTCVGPTDRPMPRLSSSRATPLAASRPKADPPERQTA